MYHKALLWLYNLIKISMDTHVVENVVSQWYISFYSSEFTEATVLTYAPIQELVPVWFCCDSYWQEM
jgi:hypothetical protein